MLEDSIARLDDSARTADAPRGVVIGPCPPSDREEALELLYRRLPSSVRPRTIAELFRQADAGALDLSGLWIARRRGRLVGAMLTQALAGRAAAIWPPEVDRGWRADDLAPALVREALLWYQHRGCRLAQALVDRSSGRRAGAELARGGLPYVTDLVYLGRPVAEPLRPALGAPALRWEGLGDENRDDFARTLERSYDGSLDMPELSGLRGLEDVLEGHRAKGGFDPERWRLGRLAEGGEAVAVVLLSRGEGRTWEVSYLGLVPSARGRGLGKAALGHALDWVGEEGDRLELAVDVRNAPAEALYRNAGFRPFDRRGVHLTVLGR
ncbi:GNAT family N-acetyltransferase [Tautonia sociabilis]|uniref:GNAT family N-acetyltransferase n=1 Tax=Tautonia sociabilis TaxID=2080755 RepID=A0A432MEC3_9BACT|nr:GNAT family N-acetyltransferase [Tautonia sociabilis]RUL83662.1 GNAT family N-acetyltransferase [Tautonia sociabilis]